MNKVKIYKVGWTLQKDAAEPQQALKIHARLCHVDTVQWLGIPQMSSDGISYGSEAYANCKKTGARGGAVEMRPLLLSVGCKGNTTDRIGKTLIC